MERLREFRDDFNYLRDVFNYQLKKRRNKRANPESQRQSGAQLQSWRGQDFPTDYHRSPRHHHGSSQHHHRSSRSYYLEGRLDEAHYYSDHYRQEASKRRQEADYYRQKYTDERYSRGVDNYQARGKSRNNWNQAAWTGYNDATKKYQDMALRQEQRYKAHLQSQKEYYNEQAKWGFVYGYQAGHADARAGRPPGSTGYKSERSHRAPSKSGQWHGYVEEEECRGDELLEGRVMRVRF